MRSLRAAIDFYHRILGLPVKLQQDTHAEMQAETFLLVLLTREDGQGAPSSSPALGWEVDDLDAVVAQLEARGVSFEDERPARSGQQDAGRRRRFRDPDGHALELICHVTPGGG